VYLDWAASAPPDPEVLHSISATAASFFANPSAVHGEGHRAEKLLEDSRSRLAGVLDCGPQQIVFTSGGTEANNMVLFSLLQPSPVSGSTAASSLSRPGLGPERRRRIVLSGLEHASVYEPAMALGRHGYEVILVPAEADGRVDPQRMLASVDEHTCLVALMLVNNETGAIQPVREVARALGRRREAGGKVHLHCDAVQGFGKISIRPKELGVDSLSLSAHKIAGPRGIGALYLKRADRSGFLYVGGGQERGRRPGTENLPGAHGLALSAERAAAGLERNYGHAQALMSELVQELRRLGGAVFVPACRGADRFDGQGFSPYILNVAFPPIPGEVLVRVLEEEEGYLISTGSACSSRKKQRFRIHESMGVSREVASSTVRISIGALTEPQDLRGLVSALGRRVPQLRRVAVR